MLYKFKDWLDWFKAKWKTLPFTLDEIIKFKDFKTKSIDTAAVIEIIDLEQPETFLPDCFYVSGNSITIINTYRKC